LQHCHKLRLLSADSEASAVTPAIAGVNCKNAASDGVAAGVEAQQCRYFLISNRIVTALHTQARENCQWSQQPHHFHDLWYVGAKTSQAEPSERR
jgi:hypothetical protein